MMHTDDAECEPETRAARGEAHEVQQAVNVQSLPLGGFHGFPVQPPRAAVLAPHPQSGSNLNYFVEALARDGLATGMPETNDPSRRVPYGLLPHLQELFDASPQRGTTLRTCPDPRANRVAKELALKLVTTPLETDQGARRTLVVLARTGETSPTPNDVACLDAFCHMASAEGGTSAASFLVMGPEETAALLELCKTRPSNAPLRKAESEIQTEGAASPSSQTSLIVVTRSERDDLTCDGEPSVCSVPGAEAHEMMRYRVPLVATVDGERGAPSPRFGLSVTHVCNLSALVKHDDAEDGLDGLTGTAHKRLLETLTSPPLLRTDVGRHFAQLMERLHGGDLDKAIRSKDGGWAASDGYERSYRAFYDRTLSLFVSGWRDSPEHAYSCAPHWPEFQARGGMTEPPRPCPETMVPVRNFTMRAVDAERQVNGQVVDIRTNLSKYAAPAVLYTTEDLRDDYEQRYGVWNGRGLLRVETFDETTVRLPLLKRADMVKGVVGVVVMVVSRRHTLQMCKYVPGFPLRYEPASFTWPVQIGRNDGRRHKVVTQALGMAIVPIFNPKFLFFVGGDENESGGFSPIRHVTVDKSLRALKLKLAGHVARSDGGGPDSLWPEAGPVVAQTTSVLTRRASATDVLTAASGVCVASRPTQNTVGGSLGTILRTLHRLFPGATSLDEVESAVVRAYSNGSMGGPLAIKRQRSDGDLQLASAGLTPLGHTTTHVLATTPPETLAELVTRQVVDSNAANPNATLLAVDSAACRTYTSNVQGGTVEKIGYKCISTIAKMVAQPHIEETLKRTMGPAYEGCEALRDAKDDTWTVAQHVVRMLGTVVAVLCGLLLRFDDEDDDEEESGRTSRTSDVSAEGEASADRQSPPILVEFVTADAGADAGRACGVCLLRVAIVEGEIRIVDASEHTDASLLTVRLEHVRVEGVRECVHSLFLSVGYQPSTAATPSPSVRTV